MSMKNKGEGTEEAASRWSDWGAGLIPVQERGEKRGSSKEAPARAVGVLELKMLMEEPHASQE